MNIWFEGDGRVDLEYDFLFQKLLEHKAPVYACRYAQMWLIEPRFIRFSGGVFIGEGFDLFTTLSMAKSQSGH